MWRNRPAEISSWLEKKNTKLGLYAHFRALSSIEAELLPVEFLYCGNREFRIFLRKIDENIKVSVRTAKLMKVMPKHIFWPCSSLYTTRVTRVQNVIIRQSVGVVTSGHVTKMAVTPLVPQLPKIRSVRKLNGSIFYRTWVIADWGFTLRDGEFCVLANYPVFHWFHWLSLLSLKQSGTTVPACD